MQLSAVCAAATVSAQPAASRQAERETEKKAVFFFFQSDSAAEQQRNAAKNVMLPSALVGKFCSFVECGVDDASRKHARRLF